LIKYFLLFFDINRQIFVGKSAVLRNMRKNRYVLNQLLSYISRYEFNKIVAQNVGDYRFKNFSHWEHFICLSFGQLAGKQSLRTIVLAFESRPEKLYHLGIRSKVSRSTLSDANRSRSWIIYQELANLLIHKAIKADGNRKIFTCEDTAEYRKINAELPQLVYAVDASTIDLCLSLFSWAKFRKKKEV
jgi:hypothetical protein